jgi:hypothetical protein
MIKGWFAKDQNGRIQIFGHEPYLEAGTWIKKEGGTPEINTFISIAEDDSLGILEKREVTLKKSELRRICQITYNEELL